MSSQGIETISATQASDQARCCDACGYDLGGVKSQQCPECGAAINERSGERLFLTAPPAVLRRMRLGAIFLVLTPWVDLVVSEVLPSHEVLGTVISSVVFLGGFTFGVWLLTPSMREGALGGLMRGPRLAFRAACLIAWLSSVLSAYFKPELSTTPLGVTKYMLGAVVPWLPFLLFSCAFLLYARFLARRSLQTRFARAFLIALVVVAAAWVVSVMYFTLSMASVLGHRWSDATYQQLSEPQHRVLSGAGAAVGSIVWWIMSIVLWRSLTLVIRRAEALRQPNTTASPGGGSGDTTQT
jgi:hypothetical protein